MRDLRLYLIPGALVAVGVIGFAINALPGRGVDVRDLPVAAKAPAFPEIETRREKTQAELVLRDEILIDPRIDPAGHMRQTRQIEIRQRLKESREALRDARYEDLLRAATRLTQLDPNLPEAQEKMGFALAAKGNAREAYRRFMAAIDLDPAHADAYFGVAITQEAFGNLEGALGGMRSFLHLSKDPDPKRLQIAQARSAIWEWESKLGRGPWGPTRGVPPGFSEAEIRRDGRGVGVKMQKGEPGENGFPEYEIRSGDKFEIFRR